MESRYSMSSRKSGGDQPPAIEGPLSPRGKIARLRLLYLTESVKQIN